MTATLMPAPRDPGVVDGLGADARDAPGVVVLDVTGRSGGGLGLERGQRRVALDGLDVLVVPKGLERLDREGHGQPVDQGVAVSHLAADAMTASRSAAPGFLS